LAGSGEIKGLGAEKLGFSIHQKFFSIRAISQMTSLFKKLSNSAPSERKCPEIVFENPYMISDVGCRMAADQHRFDPQSASNIDPGPRSDSESGAAGQ
jgi:hypothetical protein